MNLLKKIAAGLLLSWGFICLTLVVSIYMTPKEKLTQHDKDAALGLLIFGLPPAAAGGWIVRGLYRKSRMEKALREQAERDRLNSMFFQLLEENQGQITVMRLAMHSHLSAEEAQIFLDEKAKEFNATFDVTERGDVFYNFNI